MLVLAGDGLEEGLGLERLGWGHGTRPPQLSGRGHEKAGREPVDVPPLAVDSGAAAGPEGLGHDLEPSPSPKALRGTLRQAFHDRPQT